MSHVSGEETVSPTADEQSSTTPSLANLIDSLEKLVSNVSRVHKELNQLMSDPKNYKNVTNTKELFHAAVQKCVDKCKEISSVVPDSDESTEAKKNALSWQNEIAYREIQLENQYQNFLRECGACSEVRPDPLSIQLPFGSSSINSKSRKSSSSTSSRSKNQKLLNLKRKELEDEKNLEIRKAEIKMQEESRKMQLQRQMQEESRKMQRQMQEESRKLKMQENATGTGEN